MKRSIVILAIVLAILVGFFYRTIFEKTDVVRGEEPRKEGNKVSNEKSDQSLSRSEKLLSILNSRNGVIEFYGVVVDDQGNPLPEVEVSWSVMKSGAFAPSMGLSTGDKGTLLTDSGGNFFIKNSGTSISIDLLRKNEYREPRHRVRTFGYGANTEPHRPDMSKPEQFLLIKEGGAAVYKKSMHLAFDWDGKPKEFEIGVKDIKETLILIPSREENIVGVSNFYWKLVLKARNSQLIRAKKGDSPLAPLLDYRNEIILGDLEAKSVGSASALFYLNTTSGKFAEVRINAYPDRGSEEGMTARLDIQWNPSGGRSFE